MSRLIYLILVSACLLPAPAAAEPQFEIAGGYGLAVHRERNASGSGASAGKVVSVGWFGSVAAHPWRFVGVVADVTGEYATTVNDGQRVEQRAFAFLSGLRGRLRPNRQLVLFGELVAGVIHDRRLLSESSSTNRFAWQPAAGFDVALTERIAARFQGGMRYVRRERPSPNAYQFLTGIVVYVGDQ